MNEKYQQIRSEIDSAICEYYKKYQDYPKEIWINKDKLQVLKDYFAGFESFPNKAYKNDQSFYQDLLVRDTEEDDIFATCDTTNKPDYFSFYDWECEMNLAAFLAEEYCLEKEIIFQKYDGKWFFWDETYSNQHGPFDSKIDASKALEKYAEQLENSYE